MVTIAIPIYEEEEFIRPSSVKVVVSEESRALYFSRAAIPHSRDGDQWNVIEGSKKRIYGLKHIGLYAFKNDILPVLEEQKSSELESVEKLEQLKVLEKGHPIGVCIVDPALMERSIEIDTEEDLKLARSLV